jgi:3'-phosphoadenosine 5'-phosphosulfate sulfotransferase (PAPS reductase)/FAD synthetase
VTIRNLPQDDTLPGMPDALAKIPPKAKEYQSLTLDEAIERAHHILDQALAGVTIDHTRTSRGTGEKTKAKRKLEAPDAVYLLFSGGGDSSILAHLMRDRIDGVVHVRTGISIRATWTYVQAVCSEWGLPLHAAHPDNSYADLVLGRVTVKTDRGSRPKGAPLWTGFPGPAGHYFMYQRLKERALDKFRTSIVGPRGRAGQIVFLGGMRWAESDRRFRNAEEYDQWGSVLWCSPIVWWTQGHMAEYRARYMCDDLHEHADHHLCRPDALPLSEVSANLHRSGDCNCGAYAKPGELDELEFFYPEEAAEIRALMHEAKAAGVDRCIWGEGKRPDEKAPSQVGRLCSKCVPPELDGQTDIVDHWLEVGLLDPAQYRAMKAVPA